MAEDLPGFELVAYAPEHQPVFKQLNLEWLDFYHLREPQDLSVLDDPKGTILDKGGYIFLALCDGIVVGSAALMKEGENEYELAKMAVAKAHRGKGISKLLMEKCLSKAKELHAHKISLFSNHQLATAIALYQKYGFRHVEVKDSPFMTADIKMELVFS